MKLFKNSFFIFSKQGESRIDGNISDIRELLYPGWVPTFQELEKDGHKDERALVYIIRWLDTERKSPFSEAEFVNSDFGTARETYEALIKSGMIEGLSAGEELATIFKKDKLIEIARSLNISAGGNKASIANKIINAGYRIDRRKYKKRFFRITEKGKAAVRQHKADYQSAVSGAIQAIGNFDYDGAVKIYRKFDDKWGFEHAAGKIHTIFAHYDIPVKRFRFIEKYPMRELKNTDQYKRTVKAALLAGLMRGCQDGYEIRRDIERETREIIECPSLLSLFDYEEIIKDEMRAQITFDSGNALEYYISHVEYLSREACREIER